MMAEIKFDYEYSLKSKLFELRNKNKITEKEYRDLINKLDDHDQAVFKEAFQIGYYAGYDACIIESIMVDQNNHGIDERYHTCGRCKWENFPFICHRCKWGEDVRKDLWELKEEESEDEE